MWLTPVISGLVWTAMLEKGNHQVMWHLGKMAVHQARQTEGKTGRESVWLFKRERLGLYRCNGCVKAAGGNLQKQQEGCTMPKAVDTSIPQVVVDCLW